LLGRVDLGLDLPRRGADLFLHRRWPPATAVIAVDTSVWVDFFAAGSPRQESFYNF
jgi:hypothetical protein